MIAIEPQVYNKQMPQKQASVGTEHAHQFVSGLRRFDGVYALFLTLTEPSLSHL